MARSEKLKKKITLPSVGKSSPFMQQTNSRENEETCRKFPKLPYDSLALQVNYGNNKEGHTLNFQHDDALSRKLRKFFQLNISKSLRRK